MLPLHHDLSTESCVCVLFGLATFARLSIRTTIPTASRRLGADDQSPLCLRARCSSQFAAADPSRAGPSPVGRGGVEPPSLGYQPSALRPLSYRPVGSD